MDYQWDPDKEAVNRAKHRVRFADAVPVLEDERAIVLDDDYLDEERFAAIGMDALGRVLVVVYTYRNSDIRIISARRATAKEQQYYQGEI